MVTEYLDEDGNEMKLPTKWAICPDCGGEGGSSAHLGVLTTGDWEQEELDDYFAGHYDRSCSPCDGTGKLKVPNHNAMTAEQSKLVNDQDRHDHDCQMEMEAERRMGC
jgi:hypothetical protein